jgi:hypothetical protein
VNAKLQNKEFKKMKLFREKHRQGVLHNKQHSRQHTARRRRHTNTNTSNRMMKSMSRQLLLQFIFITVVLNGSRTSTTEGFSSTTCTSTWRNSNSVVNRKTAGRKNSKRQHQRLITKTTTSLNAQIFVDLLNEYQYLTQTFPLPTQSATFGTFAGVGDAIAQQKEISQAEPDCIEGDEECITDEISDDFFSTATANVEETINSDITTDDQSFDPKRTQRFFLKGLGAGLIWSQWYPLVDGWTDISSSYVLIDVLTMDDIGTAHTVAKTISSILMEQFIACPIVYSLWDIPVPALLAGTEPSKIPSLVKDKVPGLLLDNAKVWTIVNVVVYNLPVQWRVFAVSIAEIFWASIVSSVATSGESQTGFVDSQDALLGQIVDDKVEKVVEAATFTSTTLIENRKL